MAKLSCIVCGHPLSRTDGDPGWLYCPRVEMDEATSAWVHTDKPWWVQTLKTKVSNLKQKVMTPIMHAIDPTTWGVIQKTIAFCVGVWLMIIGVWLMKAAYKS